MIEKVALITGGARGIGRKIGLSLAEQGCSVSICYTKSCFMYFNGFNSELKNL